MTQGGITGLHRVDLENFSGEFKGWNPTRRTEFLKKAHAIIRNCTYSGFGVAIVKRERTNECHWLKPQLVAQIKFTEWTPDGHLRHASFVGLRDDKEARQINFKQPAP